MTYRTSTQIVADLLTATEQSGQEGIKTTHLLSKANLPHSRLVKFIDNLTGSGLINKIEFDGKKHICNYTKRQTLPRVISKIFRFCRVLWIRNLKK